jgi:hypothetical protein
MSWSIAALFVALIQAGAGHTLAQAAFLNKGLFERLNLAIQ